MKYIFTSFLFLLNITNGAEVVSADLESKRQYYQNLLEFNPASEKGLAQLYEQLDENMEQHIFEMITHNDEVINRQLITYLSYRSVPFSDLWPTVFRKPDRALLDKLRSVEGLKTFLLEQLYEYRPHYKLFEVVSILYKDDESVINALVDLGLKDEFLLLGILEGLMAAGFYNDQARPLLLKAISSYDVYVCSAAAQYVQRFPLREALPYLIRQLQRPDTDFDFTYRKEHRDRFYIPPDIKAKIEETDAQLAARNEPIEYRRDYWRSKIVNALLAYDRKELEVFAEDIFKAKDKVTFGPISQERYESLVRYLKEFHQRPGSWEVGGSWVE